MISIITPNYNRADLIKEAANSIFKQSSKDWEWIIVDDGSTDNSWQFLQTLSSKDARVKVYQRDRLPKGAPTCRNIGIDKSIGEYLIFLDSDDLLASFCIEQRLKAAQEHPDTDMLIFPMLLFRDHPDDTRLLWNIDKEMDDATRVMIGDAICQTTGPLWRRQTLINIGKWDEELLLWQDVELHLRAFMNKVSYKKLMNLSPDIFIRLSDVSISRTGFNSLPKIKSRIKVFKSSLKLAIEVGTQEMYNKGLGQMGFDLICSTIFNNHIKEAKELLNYEHRYNLFSTSDKSKLKLYYWAKRLKLYKLPLLQKLAVRPTSNRFLGSTNTLGNIKYTEEIKI
ncbi:glycosyltransferase family 2 protein [Pontibacter chitinilyticus]|uniref:glycosyltransferase family 2 protein n=1 Tax=Pontibacter chitinilyticus TaxID=2674989 RepID=UPI00321ABAB2